MSALVLLPMPGNEVFAGRLASELNCEVGVLNVRRFPDGESYVRIESEVVGREIAFVCTLREPDAQILPLLFAAKTANEMGATRVGLIAPYLAYMRQDVCFNPGEAISSIHFAALLSNAFRWLVTVDPHLHRWTSLDQIYSLDAVVVHVANEIGDWIRERVPKPLLIGPDSESRQWVTTIAERAQAPFVVLEKARHGDRDVTIAIPNLESWGDRTPVLVDDIISSAHTMIAVLRQWRDDTPRPMCVGVHAVFGGSAYEELMAANPASVVTTNSISHQTNLIDIVKSVAGAVRSIVS